MAWGWSPAGRNGETTSKAGTSSMVPGGCDTQPDPDPAARRPRRVGPGPVRQRRAARPTPGRPRPARWARVARVVDDEVGPLERAPPGRSGRPMPGLGVVRGPCPVGRPAARGPARSGVSTTTTAVQRQGLAVDGLQQRDVHAPRCSSVPRGGPCRSIMADADGRVGDGVEVGQRLGVAEGHRRPALGRSIRPSASRIPGRSGRRAAGRRGRPGLDHLAGDPVGVDQRRPVVDEQLGHRRLAGPDPAGEPDGEHRPPRSGRPPRAARRWRTAPWWCGRARRSRRSRRR